MRCFISYRRDDTRDTAGRLADRLRDTPGIKAFLDVEGIEKGAAFPERLQSELKRARVVLILIGPDWASPRLHAEGDWVRTEVAAALEGLAASRKRVIPVLINSAPMPAADALPAELAPLASLNAARLAADSFEADFERLVADILGVPEGARRLTFTRRHPVLTGFLRGIAAVVTWAALYIGAAAAYNSVTGSDFGQLFGGEVPALLVMFGGLALSVLTAVFLMAGRSR